MKRKAIYHKQSNTHRVVSVANDLWQFQEHVGRDERMRRFDSGWRDIGKPLPFDEATGAMYQRVPLT